MSLTRGQIRRSKAIQRHTGTTFHLATRLLPHRIRRPTYVLYAFFRMADEVVDGGGPRSPGEQRATLEDMRAAALGDREPDDPILAAVAELRERHDIPAAEIDAFVDAMLMDLETDRYGTHEHLSTYLRGSAAAVGQMMLEVMDPPETAAARPHATALGEALQLTNFLRDVREDLLELDRIYLPAATLKTHGASHQDVAALRFTDGVRGAVRAELGRAERRYAEGVAGIEYLPTDSQFAVLAAAVLYADYHRLIREQDFDVLSSPPSLSLGRRVSLLARTWVAWRRVRDPLAVFYTVTDLEPPADLPDTRLDGDRVGGVVARSLEWTGNAIRKTPFRQYI